MESSEPKPAQPDEDLKRRFKEALDRKRGRQADQAGGDGDGKDSGRIHHTHGPAHSKRSFRRKSG